MEPRNPQNHKTYNDADFQNLENTIAKLLKNGTVAGDARSALDTLEDTRYGTVLLLLLTSSPCKAHALHMALSDIAEFGP